MRPIFTWLLIAPAFLSLGCAALQESSLEKEARQLAWTGPGAGPCLFGGVTERTVTHCAGVNFGIEGVLSAINESVRRRVGAAGCNAHVEELRHELIERFELQTVPVYTCPEASRTQGHCHVSLLVTSSEGKRLVVDNGLVVSGTVGSGGVASLSAFEEAVEGILWVGLPPTAKQVGAAIPDFSPR